MIILLTCEQRVIYVCTFPSLELYICMHLICGFCLIICFALSSLKFKRVHNSNWYLPFLIQTSTTTSNLLFNIKVLYPSLFKLINIFTHSLIHQIHLLAFGTDGLWYCSEGLLLGTLHPTRPGPNLFYVGDEEEPGWGQCFTDPRRKGGSRSLTMHSLDILALRIETVGTC